VESSAVLTTLAACVALGALAQGLASVSRLPAIVFLLLLGMIAGPHGIGLINPSSLHEGLPVLTAIFVSIILFEGGLTLRPQVLREAIKPVRRLVTIGLCVTLFGGAVAAHFLLYVPWPEAFLFASLIVVTGPTVITPILRRIRLKPRVHGILKSEAIIIDPIGANIAVVLLQYVLAYYEERASWQSAVWAMTLRATTGIVIGGGLALAAAFVLRLRFFQHRDQIALVNLVSLATALLSFAVSESLYHESGVMAATVAGLTLGALPIPFREELEHFKEQLTVLGVSLLFLLLAANVAPGMIWRIGWGEVLLLASLIFVVRPLAVWASTFGEGLDWRSWMFVSLIAPRGIVAAAMAAHVADQLHPLRADSAELIESLVFLTIAATVLLQGCWAGTLARALDQIEFDPPGVLIVGVNELSLTLAEQLTAAGTKTTYMDNSRWNAGFARRRCHTVVQGDATQEQSYEDLDWSELGWCVAMTGNDALNTLVCDAAKVWFFDEQVLQVVAKPDDIRNATGVRLSGRRAMASNTPHAVICSMLSAGRLRIVERSDGEDSTPKSGRKVVVPLLERDELGVRVHTSKSAESTVTTVMELVEADDEEPASRANAERVQPEPYSIVQERLTQVTLVSLSEVGCDAS